MPVKTALHAGGRPGAACLLLMAVCCWLGLASPASAAGSAPRQLATDIARASLLGPGRALVQTSAGKFSAIDLASGRAVSWQLDWTPAEDGWDAPAGDEPALPNFSTSRDGRLVAFGFNVQTGNGAVKPEDAAPLFETAIVLCAADGSGARCVGLAEPTDGGPRLYFTQDGSLLVGPDYLPCDPDPDSLRGWYRRMDEVTDGPMPPPVNAVETLSGRRFSLPALVEAAWLDKCPYSDDYFFDEMDTPVVHFGTLAGPHAGLHGAFRPAGDEGFTKYDWCAPGLQLCWYKGRQVVVGGDGELHALQSGVWVSYCWLPDGRSVFSRDGGKTIETGQVDWPGGKVRAARPHRELAPYALPVNREGWAERTDRWLPLGDGRGALVLRPDSGELALVQL